MPNYNVISPGFRHGRLYDPRGKRSVLVEGKPFTGPKGENPKPCWVGDVIEATKIADEVEVSVDKSQAQELRKQALIVAEEEALSEQAARDSASGKKEIISEGGRTTEVSGDVLQSEQAQPSKPGNGNTEVLG